MPSIHPKQIVAAIPSALTIILPDQWFEELPDNVSVFESLYRWMVTARGVGPDRLHNRTYAGAGIAKRLLRAERRRIKRRRKIRGPELDKALNLSDMDSGPHTMFAERRVLGDALVVISELEDEKAEAVMNALLMENRETNNRSIRAMSSGGDFGQWLISNSERDDIVGDLANDVLRDASFPRAANHYQEAFDYMKRHGACSAALDALAEAWMEYRERYPERIKLSAWCAACEKKIVELCTGIVAWTDDNGLQVLHQRCLHGEEKAATTCLADFTGDEALERLTDFAERYDIPCSLVAQTEKLLRLWGFGPHGRSRKGTVYFIQASSSGPIKIGYSTGPAERRLAALQTAHPEQLRLLAELDGDRDTEADLHRRFNAHRRSGEWFAPHPDLIEFIAVIRRRQTAQ